MKLDKIIIQRSYVHAIEQLTSLEYFSQDQIKCINKELVIQLKDIAFEVNKRKYKKQWGKCSALNVHWLSKLYLNGLTANLNLNICKLVYSINLDMKEIFLLIGKMINAFIWKFPLKVEPTNYQTPDEEMTFGDFIIRYKHKFLRNIYTKEQINYFSGIKDLQSYCETFQKFIHT